MNGYQAPPLTKTNKYILILIVALFVIQSIGQAVGAFSLIGFFGLIPAQTLPWRIYTLLTYPWIESGLFSVLFNGLALWFLGSELESSWGPRIYLKFLFTSVVAAGVLYLLFVLLVLQGTWLGGGVLVGPAGLTYSLCVAYAVLYPNRQFLMMFAFPVQAKYFCMIMAGVELYMAMLSGNPASWGHLFAMGVAFLLIRYQTLPALAWWFRDGKTMSKGVGRGKSASHLKLVDKNDNKPNYWH